MAIALNWLLAVGLTGLLAIRLTVTGRLLSRTLVGRRGLLPLLPRRVSAGVVLAVIVARLTGGVV